MTLRTLLLLALLSSPAAVFGQEAELAAETAAARKAEAAEPAAPKTAPAEAKKEAAETSAEKPLMKGETTPPEPAPEKAKPAAPAKKAEAEPVEQLPLPEEQKPAVLPVIPGPKGAAKPKAAEPFKPIGAAAPYEAIAQEYADAKAKFEEWLKDASAQAADLDKRETELKKDIQAKEAEKTELQFDSSKDAKRKVKALAQETKLLWGNLKRLEAEKAALKKSLARGAGQTVRQLNAAVEQKLEAAQRGDE